MSLIYMKVLEEDPETYDQEFEKLLSQAPAFYSCIIKELKNKSGKILEIGSGTGSLSKQLSKMGFEVIAIDISQPMVEYAKNILDKEKLTIDYHCGDFLDYNEYQKLNSSGPYDFIISTFTLSEFTPLRQNLFLKQVKSLLKKGGSFYIAAEVYPTSKVKRMKFSLKRFIYAQISIFKSQKTTFLIKDFLSMLDNYFDGELLLEKNFIQLWKCVNPKDISYKPKHVQNQLGKFTILKKYWCILNGIFTRKAIKPGLYVVGNPTKDSKLLVTANYYWTVNDVYNSLIKQKFDCYLLIIDSNGINVWCAAGGGHFTHTQIIDALRLFDVEEFINHKNLVLPQLAATGVDQKELKKFEWKPKFGTTYIEDVSSIKEENSDRKLSDLRKIKFDLRFRTQMGLQHTFFVLLVLFLPLICLTWILSLFGDSGFSFMFNASFQLTIIAIIISMIFALIYPAFNFINSFLWKGIVVGILVDILLLYYLSVYNNSLNFATSLFWLSLVFLICIFICIDFAGHTPYSNHLAVESDLVFLSIPAIILIITAIIAISLDKVNLLII